MNKIELDIKQLNENKFNYLSELFDSCFYTLDDFKSYLENLKDTELNIKNIGELNDESSEFVKIINEVHNDYNNFELNYNLNKEYDVVIDIDELNERKHDYLIEVFDLPDYYGRNLDALYDCMSEREDTTIAIKNMKDVKKFSLDVLSVFDDVADEYQNLNIIYLDEDNNEKD